VSAPAAMPKIVLVCGSRRWWSHRTIISCLRSAKAQGFTHVVHGGSRGADAVAAFEAKHMGLKVIAVPALWKRYGKEAGPIRNRSMLELRPQLVLAFTSSLSRSKGTAHMVSIARNAGIPVRVFHQ